MKRIICFVLSAFLCLSSLVFGLEAKFVIEEQEGSYLGSFFFIMAGNRFYFDDVMPGSWYTGAVNYLKGYYELKGTSDFLFSPNICMSRGEAIYTMVESYRIKLEMDTTEFYYDTITKGFSHVFKDVPENNEYAFSIDWAFRNGITSGMKKDEFGIDSFVTRQDFLSWMYRLVILYCRQTEFFDVWPSAKNYKKIEQKKDYILISQYAKPAMNWACTYQYIVGDSQGNVMPKKRITRAEVAYLVAELVAEAQTGVMRTVREYRDRYDSK